MKIYSCVFTQKMKKIDGETSTLERATHRQRTPKRPVFYVREGWGHIGKLSTVTLNVDRDKIGLHVMYSRMLVHLPTKLDENIYSGFGASARDGPTDRQTDRQTDGQTERQRFAAL